MAAQLTRFALAEVARRPRERGLLFAVPGPELDETVSAGIEALRELPVHTELVVVSGADLIQSFDVAASYGLSESRSDRLAILPVSPGTWQDRFGGGRELEALQPPLVDILVPPGESQERLLSDFDSRSNRPVRLKGVVPAELEPSQAFEKNSYLSGSPGR